MKIKISHEDLIWVDAKRLEDDIWRLPEIEELYKIFDLGLLKHGQYYWSNTPSKSDINWKKCLALTFWEDKYPRELEGYKNGIKANVILIKKNQ